MMFPDMSFTPRSKGKTRMSISEMVDREQTSYDGDDSPTNRHHHHHHDRDHDHYHQENESSGGVRNGAANQPSATDSYTGGVRHLRCEPLFILDPESRTSLKLVVVAAAACALCALCGDDVGTNRRLQSTFTLRVVTVTRQPTTVAQVSTARKTAKQKNSKQAISSRVVTAKAPARPSPPRLELRFLLLIQDTRQQRRTSKTMASPSGASKQRVWPSRVLLEVRREANCCQPRSAQALSLLSGRSGPSWRSLLYACSGSQWARAFTL